MKGKVLTVALMSLVLLLACFAAGPVVSGEHPWDSDRDDDDKFGDGGMDPGLLSDTIYILRDTTVIQDVQTEPPDSPVAPDYVWYSVYTSVISAMSAAF